jgi:hypothetical protein
MVEQFLMTFLSSIHKYSFKVGAVHVAGCSEIVSALLFLLWLGMSCGRMLRRHKRYESEPSREITRQSGRLIPQSTTN